MASVTPITLKSPGIDLKGSARRRKKKLKISKEGKKRLGYNPEIWFQADQEKTSQDFKQTNTKKKEKSSQQRQYLLSPNLARKAEQSSASQSPAGVTGIRFLAWGSSPKPGRGAGCPQRSWDDK